MSKSSTELFCLLSPKPTCTLNTYLPGHSLTTEVALSSPYAFSSEQVYDPSNWSKITSLRREGSTPGGTSDGMERLKLGAVQQTNEK